MNEEKFSGKGGIYAKFRPSYPKSLIDYLYNETGFTSKAHIGDIGAGTGIFSRYFLQRHSRVTCVEPNEDMLHQAQEKLKTYQNCFFVKASAEHTTLESQSLDFVTVAQAFHWFDREQFKKECQRILKNQGKVVLVWNHRDPNEPITIKNAQLNQRLCPSFKGFSGGTIQKPEAYADFFKNGCCDYQVFKNDLVFDREHFLGRSLTGSYAPKEGDKNFAEFVEAIEKLFNQYEQNGLVHVANNAHCYIGQV